MPWHGGGWFLLPAEDGGQGCPVAGERLSSGEKDSREAQKQPRERQRERWQPTEATVPLLQKQEDREQRTAQERSFPFQKSRLLRTGCRESVTVYI